MSARRRPGPDWTTVPTVRWPDSEAEQEEYAAQEGYGLPRPEPTTPAPDQCGKRSTPRHVRLIGSDIIRAGEWQCTLPPHPGGEHYDQLTDESFGGGAA